MEITEQQVRQIVESIVTQFYPGDIPQQVTSAGEPGVFSDIQSAIAAARTAHQELMNLTLETRKAMIQNMRDTILEHNEQLSRKAMEETGLGCWRDKLIKHEVVATKTPGVEDLQAVSYTDDHGMTLSQTQLDQPMMKVTPIWSEERPPLQKTTQHGKECVKDRYAQGENGQRQAN